MVLSLAIFKRLNLFKSANDFMFRSNPGCINLDKEIPVTENKHTDKFNFSRSQIKYSKLDFKMMETI